MIVQIDQTTADITILAERRQEVVVRVSETATRRAIDNALMAVGAGCVPDHHAELDVDWLTERYEAIKEGERCVATAQGTAATRPWLDPSRLDDSGRWLATPIEWVCERQWLELS